MAKNTPLGKQKCSFKPHVVTIAQNVDTTHFLKSLYWFYLTKKNLYNFKKKLNDPWIDPDRFVDTT